MSSTSTPSRQKSWQRRRRPVSVLAEMALRKERVAQKLASLRERNGLTQEQAAAKVGVTMRQWQRWEAGQSVPYPRNLDGIASKFGITVGEFFDEDNAGPPPDDGDTRVMLRGLYAEIARLNEKIDTLMRRDEEQPPDAATG